MSNDETDRGGEKELPTLEYQRGVRWREGPFAKWVGRRPEWMIALALVLPVWVADLLGVEHVLGHKWGGTVGDWVPYVLMVAIFVAGAVRRMRWGQGLIMIGLACACELTCTWIPKVLPFRLAPWGTVLECAVPVMALVVGESLLARPRSARALGWALLLAVAATSVIVLVETNLTYSFPYAHLPRFARYTEIPWQRIVHVPMLALAAWAAVHSGRKLARSATLVWRVVVGGAAMGLSGAMVLYLSVLIYPMAAWSLTGAGPFDRSKSIWILASRGRDSDRDAMWTALERADWSKPPWDDWRDYRPMCIAGLREVDKSNMGKRLAALLCRRPTAWLANFSAGTLGAEKRYETAAVLMRYALQSDSTCTAALEEMGVPQAAWAVILEAIKQDRPVALTGDYPISRERRHRLTKLLGRDAGDHVNAWIACYDEVIADCPTPLSAETAKEMQRMIQAMVLYWNTLQTRSDARNSLALQRLERDGWNGVVEKWKLVARGTAAFSWDESETVHDYLVEAEKNLYVATPDWDAPDTAALEREVEAYGKRVEEIIGKWLGPATRPK